MDSHTRRRASRRQQRAQARLVAAGDDALTRATSVLSERQPVGETWRAAVDAALGGLAEADCRFVRGAPPALPIVARPSPDARGREARVVLPHAGAAVPVSCEGVVVGHLVVVPRPSVAPLCVDRRVLAALADHVAFVITPLREVDGRWTGAAGD